MAAKMISQQRGTMRNGQLFADLTAVGAAGRALGDEARSRLVDVGLDLIGAHSQQGADLAVSQTVQHCQDQGCTLALRELEQRGEQLIEILPRLELRHGVLSARPPFADLTDGSTLADDAQAGVAGDREQPRAQVDAALVREQRFVSGGERRLDGVLGVAVGAEDVTAEGQQLPTVTVVERFEGLCIAAAHIRHKPIVAHGTRPRARADTWLRSDTAMTIGQLPSPATRLVWAHDHCPSSIVRCNDPYARNPSLPEKSHAQPRFDRPAAEGVGPRLWARNTRVPGAGIID